MPTIELGNVAPKHPCADPKTPRVTYIHIPTAYTDALGNVHYETADGLDVEAAKRHIAERHSPYLEDNQYGITRMSDLGAGKQEPLLTVIHPSGVWFNHSFKNPSFVSCPDDPILERYLSEHFQVAAGRPADLYDRYHTRFGPPGVGPWAAPVEGLVTNVGRTLWANMMGGGQVGYVGTATASAATSLTDTSAAWTTNQWAGYRVYDSATGVWANIESNTATVLTVDQWYNPAAPGGAAGATPAGTDKFIIADGGSVSAWFVGLTTTNITAAATDTSLSGEVTTNGLNRKIAPFAITQATSPVKYTLTPVYTFTGNTATTLYAIGVFNSMVVADVTDTMMFETSLASSATVSANGDQLTVTETVTGP